MPRPKKENPRGNPKGNPSNLPPEKRHKLTREEQSRGGKNCAAKKRQHKLVRESLLSVLDGACEDMPQFRALATQLGIDPDSAVQDLLAVASVMNAMKEGRLSELETLQRILGETENVVVFEDRTEDAFSKSLREEAERMNNGE